MTSNFLRILMIFFYIGSFASAQNVKIPGWLWYNEKKPSQKKNPQQSIKPKDKESAKTAKDILKERQDAFDESLAKAVLDPTPQNIRHLQLMHAAVYSSSEKFQKMWTAMASMEKPFGNTIQNPRTQEIVEEKREKKRLQKIHSLSKRFGLFFVFSSNCTYCHEFAPLIKEFASDYGFEVMGITPDGHGIKEFPSPKKDNGILKTLNPEGSYPALFLVDPKTNLVIPIARSLLNRSQLEENIMHVLHYVEKNYAH